MGLPVQRRLQDAVPRGRHADQTQRGAPARVRRLWRHGRVLQDHPQGPDRPRVPPVHGRKALAPFSTASSPFCIPLKSGHIHSFTGFYLVVPSFNEFHSVLPSFTGFYWFLLSFTEFYCILPNFTGFCLVLPSSTGFYRVLLFFGFYLVLLGFIGSYLVLLNFTVFYLVLPSLNEFYLVLPSFTGYYWVLPSFTGFYRVYLFMPSKGRPYPVLDGHVAASSYRFFFYRVFGFFFWFSFQKATFKIPGPLSSNQIDGLRARFRSAVPSVQP